jgi:HSP20 family protein
MKNRAWNGPPSGLPYHLKNLVAELHRDDITDVADDVRALLAEIDRGLPDAGRLRGECRPPLDVIETATSIEVVVDIPGVTANVVRVLMRRNVLLVVGAKGGSTTERPKRVHVAERNYGRFARTVRVDAAVDAKRATASLRAGQLRVVLPRVTDRRGQAIPIQVDVPQ